MRKKSLFTLQSFQNLQLLNIDGDVNGKPFFKYIYNLFLLCLNLYKPNIKLQFY